MVDEQTISPTGLTREARAHLPQLRDERGHFLKGTRGGPGNSTQRQVSEWRRQLIKCVSIDDIAEVISVLVEAAKKGKRWAVIELLDRCLGRQTSMVELAAGEDAPKRIILIDTRTPVPDTDNGTS